MRDLDDDTARTYIHEATQISRAAATLPDDVVEAIQFLLWRPSRAQLLKTLTAMCNLAAPATLGNETETMLILMSRFVETFHRLKESEWTRPGLEPVIANTTQTVRYLEQSTGFRVLRCSLLGSESGPQIIPLLLLLGREETVWRMEAARDVLKSLRGHNPARGPAFDT